MGTYLTPAPASRGRFFVAVIIIALVTLAPNSQAQSDIKISGQVIDKTSGSPVPGAQISIQDLGKHTISDEAGQFRFTDLPSGRYSLNVKRLGYGESGPIAVDIQSVSPAHVVIPLEIRPIVVVGQNIISDKSPQINISFNGNTTILDLQPGVLQSIASIFERVPELELIDSGPQKILRLRGSQSNAVVVMLDGRIQNSALTSQGDISTVPLAQVRRIEITKGGDYNSGGLAGSVNFITSRLQDDSYIRSQAQHGSFGMKSYSLGLAQSRMVFYARDSFIKGDFKYRDPRDSIQTRDNNSSHDLNIFGGIGLPLRSTKIDLKARYFTRNAGVPGPIFQLSPRANSKSREMEIYSLSETDLGRGYGASVIGGISSRDMTFDSPQTATNFIAYKNRFIEHDRDIKFQFERKGDLNFDSYLSWRYESLDGRDLIRPASSFGRHSRLVNVIGMGITAPLLKSGSILKFASANLGAKREDGSGAVFWGPSGGVTASFGAVGLNLSAYHSRRLPDLTDLFWKEDVFATPNPDLRPEKSFGYEVGLAFRAKRFGPCNMKASYFDGMFDDIIIWRKWAGDKFKPVNLSKAEISGLEMAFDFKPFDGPFSLFWNADFNRPLNKEESPVHHDKYLTFRPIGTQNAGVEIEYKRATLKLSGRHLGRRYTTEENTKSLPPVDLFDLDIGYDLKIRSISLKAAFSILNIGNKEYEILDRQPEKPREYRLEIEISRFGGLI